MQDHGDALYRRSMYTFWKRTSPPPSLTTFDAPSREECTVRRGRTNTPLQALVLMNDEQYVEAARHLAERMMREGGPTPAERIAFGFRLATSRQPTADELRIFQRLFDAQPAAYPKTRRRPRNCWASANRRTTDLSTRGAGRLDDGGQRDPESGRNGHQRIRLRWIRSTNSPSC